MPFCKTRLLSLGSTLNGKTDHVLGGKLDIPKRKFVCFVDKANKNYAEYCHLEAESSLDSRQLRDSKLI